MVMRKPVALKALVILTLVVMLAHLLLLGQVPALLHTADADHPAPLVMLTRTITPTATPTAPPTPKAAAPSPAPDQPAPQASDSATPAATPPATGDTAPAPIAALPHTHPVDPEPEIPRPVTAAQPRHEPDPTTSTAAQAPPPEPTASSLHLDMAHGTVLHATMPPPARLKFRVSARSGVLPYSASAELLWQHDGTHYNTRLAISAFLLGERVQTSEGDITPQGLAPRRFADKFRSEQAAHFRRDSQTITFSANTPDAVLQPGAQDRLSLFLQLSALLEADPHQLAPGTTLTLQTVGPRDAESWMLAAESLETLNLPVGTVSALKLTRAPRHTYDLRVELWLSPAYHYLPVRIRLTQANGDFVDQELTSVAPL